MTEEAEASLDQRFAARMGELLGPEFPSDIALAVSGGGDSMAMLALAHNWARVWGTRLWVVTVDHGLRPESGEEAALVAAECAALGRPHEVLQWHWDGQGNLAAAARQGRLEMIDRWRGAISHVLMAHTQDDVAETFLMRLRRGAGVQGLAAMRACRFVPSQALVPEEGAGQGRLGYHILRPCLRFSRAELRHYLRTLKVGWVEDPSNDDPRYDRARMRKLLALLAEEGLDAAALAGSAERLASTRTALARRAADVWHLVGKEEVATGILRFAPEIADVERETGLRLLAAALRYVASAPYAPRETALEALWDRVVSGGRGTLHGCEVRHEGRWISVLREWEAVGVVRVQAGPGALWDRRWRVWGARLGQLTVGALGQEGWQQARGAQQSQVRHADALSLPALWNGAELVHCGPLGFGTEHDLRLELAPMGQAAGFTRFVLSH